MLAPHRSGPNIRRRMASMTAAWLFLGTVIGIHIGWRLNAGPVAIVSHVIAGWIVFSFAGVAISLLGGRWKESLLGALCGTLVGLVAELWNWAAPPGAAFNQCLVVGAIVGATFRPWVTLALKILLGIKSGLAFVVRFRPSRVSTKL